MRPVQRQHNLVSRLFPKLADCLHLREANQIRAPRVRLLRHLVRSGLDSPHRDQEMCLVRTLPLHLHFQLPNLPPQPCSEVQVGLSSLNHHFKAMVARRMMDRSQSSRAGSDSVLYVILWEKPIMLYPLRMTKKQRWEMRPVRAIRILPEERKFAPTKLHLSKPANPQRLL